MTKSLRILLASAAVSALSASAAMAQLKVGITVSQTGPAAALGIPKRTVERYIAKALAHCLDCLQM